MVGVAGDLLVEHRLHQGPEEQAVIGGHEVDRPAHDHDADHRPVDAARELAWHGPDDPGDWHPVTRTFRAGHTERWWAADATLGSLGPDSARLLVVATKSGANLGDPDQKELEDLINDVLEKADGGSSTSSPTSTSTSGSGSTSSPSASSTGSEDAVTSSASPTASR